MKTRNIEALRTLGWTSLPYWRHCSNRNRFRNCIGKNKACECYFWWLVCSKRMENLWRIQKPLLYQGWRMRRKFARVFGSISSLYGLHPRRGFCISMSIIQNSVSRISSLQIIFVPSWTSSKGDKHAINRIVLEGLEDCAQNNVKYIELRFCPFLLASAEIEPHQESL